MTRETVFSIFFLALLVFIIYNVILIFLPFLAPAFWAFVVVFAFFPVCDLVVKFTGRNRFAASLLMTVLVLILIVAPMTALVFYLSEKAFDLYFGVRDFVTSGEWKDFVARVKASYAFQILIQQKPQLETLSGDQLGDQLLAASRHLGNWLAGRMAHLTKNLIVFVFQFLIFVCLVFAFFQRGREIFNFVYDLVPMAEPNKNALRVNLNTMLVSIIRGQFLTCLIQAVIAGTVFALMGIPLFVFFGILTFFSALIPVLGAAAVWAPIALWLLFTGAVHKGILLGVVGLFGISLMDNFLKPIFIGSGARIPIFLIFLGILGGIQAYGITGVFVGPIVLAVFFTLVKIFHDRYIA